MAAASRISRGWVRNGRRARNTSRFIPNVLFGVHRDHAFAILLEPVAQDRTREHVSLYYASEEMCGEAMAGLRAANRVLWRDVFVEDVFVVEGMQSGRRAMGFDGGHFSPVMDSPTHVFHAWVADRFLGL